MSVPASVLITGGTGFLGRALIAELLAQGCERICVYSRGEYAQAQARREFRDDLRMRWFIGDVRDAQRLERAMQGVDAVVHAAALKRIEVGAYNPDEVVKTNVLGSQNVIEAARRANVAKCLLVSSDKAFEPVSPYGHSKALAEALFLAADRMYPRGPRYAAVRYGNVWNSTGSVVPLWRAHLADGNTSVPVTDPACTRFFMRSAEAVGLVLYTLESMRGGEVNVPQLSAYELKDLALAFGAEMRVTGLSHYEKLHETMAPGVCSRDAPRLTVNELQAALANA